MNTQNTQTEQASLWERIPQERKVKAATYGFLTLLFVGGLLSIVTVFSSPRDKTTERITQINQSAGFIQSQIGEKQLEWAVLDVEHLALLEQVRFVEDQKRIVEESAKQLRTEHDTLLAERASLIRQQAGLAMGQE